MKVFRCVIAILLIGVFTKGESFLQYSFGASQDSNNQFTQTLQRSYFHELSYYYELGKTKNLFLGIAYSRSSSYQTEANNSSTTQVSSNPLLSMRYYLTKNQNIGLTLQFAPVAQLYQETDSASANWTGTVITVKPGIYISMKSRFQLAIELTYMKSNYTKKSALSGTIQDTNFSRTQTIPSLGIIWNFK